MACEKDFWDSIGLLLSVEAKRSDRDLKTEVHDWVEKLVVQRSDAALEGTTDSKRNRQLNDGEVEEFVAKLNLPPIECKFSHPQIQSKLEMLMGSNMVSLTDRNYMIYLQERIMQDYANSMAKRITARQADEMERVKNLVLIGKIPLDQAPVEMANHPVMMIDQYCKKVLAERRAKIKVLKPFIPKYLFGDDTPDPPSGLSIESGHVLRKDNDRLCIPPDLFLCTEDSENITDGYMLSEEEFELLKYENSLIKELKQCETVEQMYILADEIIGMLQTISYE